MGRTAEEVARAIQEGFVENILAQLAAAQTVRIDFAAAHRAAVRAVLRDEDSVELLVLGVGGPLPAWIRKRLADEVAHDFLVACALAEQNVEYLRVCLPCPYRGPRPFTCGYPFLKSILPLLSGYG